MSASLQILLADLGDWRPAGLLAEYDPRSGAVRINARAHERIRILAGECEARAFLLYAIAHELAHAAGCDERAAHAHAQACTGRDRRAFEAIAGW